MGLIQLQADSTSGLKKIFCRNHITEKHSESEFVAIISTHFSILIKERGELASF